MREKIRPHGHGPKWRSILLWNVLQSAIQPTIFRGFQSRRARFHEVLRVKVRARRIGVNRRRARWQVGFCETTARAARAGVQSEKSVQVDRRITIQLGVCKDKPRTPAAALGLRNRNGRTQAIVIRFAKRHDDIQSVGCAALEQDDKLPFCSASASLPPHAAKRGHCAQPNHGHAALLQKNTAAKISGSHAFTAFVTHCDFSLLECGSPAWPLLTPRYG